jgi:hypothetical protein
VRVMAPGPLARSQGVWVCEWVCECVSELPSTSTSSSRRPSILSEWVTVCDGSANSHRTWQDAKVEPLLHWSYSVCVRESEWVSEWVSEWKSERVSESDEWVSERVKVKERKDSHKNKKSECFFLKSRWVWKEEGVNGFIGIGSVVYS